MIIRNLDLTDDEDMFVSGIKDFVSRMGELSSLPASHNTLVLSIQQLIDLGVLEVLVAEYEKKLIGGIGMLYSSYIWNKGILIAEEQFFWTSTDAPITTALRLIQGARVRAKEYGCSYWFLKSLISSPDKLENTYKTMGLSLVETTYMGPV